MNTILIVEDDQLINEGLSFMLQQENYNTISACSYQEGWSAFTNHKIDLIILDINLPDQSGTVLCEEIRKSSQVPILFLTANDTEQDMVKGFCLGADDYIAKPFSMLVLSKRIEAILRRSHTHESDNLYTYANLAINFDKMQVYKKDQEVKLTANEYKLMAILAQNNGQVLTRQMILEKLWDVDGNFVDENTLRVNIKRLRNKLEDDPKNPAIIKTVFGIGYTWGD
ncbi:response regulator transcription factor [Paenibacillus faecalis]|uniref:response regulator transcription factor n=1 Tax=Paenibacillus faecalis TaxID=2079532 RepID=UPI000D0F4CB4|nr:response regulator transcription factor [Paenibacillus faecalis]